MANKVIIGILVLLVILMGGIGYYSYMLNQRVDYLSEQLTAFERAQTARVDAVSSELTEFRGETLSSVNALEDKISKNMAEIDALEEEMGEKSTQMASLEGEIARSEQLLANVGFTTKAPPEVVCREREKLERYQKEREKLQEELDGLGK